ncbi:MAG: DUF305 domain-containing protein [Chitinophagaceae bacterium]
MKQLRNLITFRRIGAVLAVTAMFSPVITCAQHNSSLKKDLFLLMMDTMMIKMDQTPKNVSNDSFFILQMIPHHQGAVSMAEIEISHGKDFTMIQLAKKILAEQSVEIQQMKAQLQMLSGDSVPISRDFQKLLRTAMMKMMDNMPEDKGHNDTDRSFASVMIAHHRAAIDMAMAILKYTKDMHIINFARQIIATEKVEIEQMSSFLK